jgi:hypothetical protein
MIDADGAPSTFGASCPPFTSSYRANSIAVDRVHGRGSSTTIGWGGAIVGEKVKRERRRRENEASFSEGKEARPRKENKKEGSRC